MLLHFIITCTYIFVETAGTYLTEYVVRKKSGQDFATFAAKLYINDGSSFFDRNNLISKKVRVNANFTTRIIDLREKKPTNSGFFPYNKLIQRDKLSLDIFWLKDDSLEDSANLLTRI